MERRLQRIFLHVASGSANGSGTSLVVFAYDANSGTGPRTGTLTVAGLTVTVTQAGTNSQPVAGPLSLIGSGLNEPILQTVDSAGNLYIADNNNGAIKQLSTATGLVSTLVSSGLSHPYDVAVDSSGNLYIAASTSSDGIYTWSPGTRQLAVLPNTAGSYYPGIAADGAGNVYFTRQDAYPNYTVGVWNRSTQQVSVLASALPTLNGIAVDVAGNLYLVDTRDNTILKWSAATQQVTTVITGLSSPNWVAVDQTATSTSHHWISPSGNGARAHNNWPRWPPRRPVQGTPRA